MNASRLRRRTVNGHAVLEDRAGHLWPLTGHWCSVCGMPLLRVNRDDTAHPTCCDKPRP